MTIGVPEQPQILPKKWSNITFVITFVSPSEKTLVFDPKKELRTTKKNVL